MKERTKWVCLGLGMALVYMATRDDGASGPIDWKKALDPKKPPSQVPLPSGWKHYGGTVSEVMTAEAVNALALPLGSLVDRGNWGVFVEWHPPDARNSRWHKGSSIVVRA